MWRPRSRFHFRDKGFRELSGDRSGAVTLEFALIATPVIGLVVGILESLITQYHVSALDHAVQKYASELRSGAEMIGINSSLSTAEQVDGVRRKIGARLPASFDPNKLQIKVVSKSNCSATVRCWAGEYSSIANGVRKPPAFDSRASLPFDIGDAGHSAYMTVYYPLPAMSSLWNSAPTAFVNGEKVYGIMSTAMWINDPSVGVFGTAR